VVLKTHLKGTERTIPLTVSAGETISCMKDRVSEIEPSPFPLKLWKGAAVLGGGDDGQKLADCGVKDGDTLAFTVEASEAVFVQQLTQLLQAKALSASELSLIYCHRHGVTVAQTLGLLGSQEPFEDFLKRQKGLSLEQGTVQICKPVAVDAPAQAEGEAEELNSTGTLDLSVSVWIDAGAETMDLDGEVGLALDSLSTVREAKEAVIAAELIPFSDVDLMLNDEILQDDETLAGCGVQNGCDLDFIVRSSESALVQQLTELLEGGPRSSNELSLLFCNRHGVPVDRALRMLGREKFCDFLARHPTFTCVSGCISLSRHQKLPPILDETSMATSAEVARDQAVAAVSKAAFLNIQRVVKYDSSAAGTDTAGSDAVILVAGLPPGARSQWHPQLLESVAAVLREQGSLSSLSMKNISVVGTAVEISTADATVRLRFAAAN